MDIANTYLAAAEVIAGVAEHPAVAQAWQRPSVLPRMSVGELAAHLTRSVRLVRDYLDAQDPGALHPITAEAYFGGVPGLPDIDSQVNIGVRQRSRDDATVGPDEVTRSARKAHEELSRRLPGVAADRQIVVFGDRPMHLQEFLRSRLVEFAVHHDDLDLSLPDADPRLPDLPEAARSVAIHVLVGVARWRHGDLAVLRALARRERDADEVLRVL